MPQKAMDDWLSSRKTHKVLGHALRPQAHPIMPATPLSVSRGQAEAFYLQGDGKEGWIIKKFHPQCEPDRRYSSRIATLLPAHDGFASGTQRFIVDRKATRAPADLAQWLDGTVLMPRIRGVDWANVADNIRAGTLQLTDDQRFTLCKNLATLIELLEAHGVSHRDLSSGNVFIDTSTLDTHLIDWDSLYHASLDMPANTTCGTPGYVAPFALQNGTAQADTLWNAQADRFALAMMCTEFLVIERGSPVAGDGGIFSQQELGRRSGSSIAKAREGLARRAPHLAPLFEQALHAADAVSCPTPAQWVQGARPLAPITPIAPIADDVFLQILNRRKTLPPIFHQPPPLPPPPTFNVSFNEPAAKAPPLPTNPWST